MERTASRSLLFAALAVLPLAATPCRALAGEPADAATGGVSFEPGTPPFADVLAKAKAAGKPVFVDFFTEW